MSALTQPAVRRDAVGPARDRADTRLLRKAAGSLPGFRYPALVVWASEDRVRQDPDRPVRLRVTAAKGMAARYLDVVLIAAAGPV